MNKNVRKRYLQSHWYALLVAPLLVTGVSIFVANYLSASKPEERFYVFLTGEDILNSNIKTRIKDKMGTNYSYLLDFNINFQQENTTTYGSFLLTDGFKYADLIVYRAGMFEENFNNNFDKYFSPIDSELANGRYGSSEYISKDGVNYAIKIHSKGSDVKNETLGIEFRDDDYYISIRKDSVHQSKDDDASYTCLEAFIC